MNGKLTALRKRKDTILKTINDQGKLTDSLRQRIETSWDATEIEDIYLPFKPKRRTRAQVAREKGLEPLATLIMLQREQDPASAAKRFVGKDVATTEEALQGAKYIIA